jgi:uncharacterized membrane protein
MYWLGVRQQRPYARLLAYVVLAGAGWKLMQEIVINTSSVGPVLAGTWVGPVIYAAAASVMWALHRRMKEAGPNEAVLGEFLPWIAAAAITILPWEWFVPAQAATATAFLALALFAFAQVARITQLAPVVTVLQVFAVVAFASTLQRAAGLDPSGPALGRGLEGAIELAAIAMTLLATAGYTLLRTRRDAIQRGLPPHWSMTSSLVIVAGVLLLHLTPLFGASLRDTAQWWPLTACAVLWVALSLSHTLLAVAAAALQFAAALIFVHFLGAAPADAAAFANATFLVPMLFAATWLLSGDWIRATAHRRVRGVNEWCDAAYARWLPVLGGLAFWLTGWLFEIERLLARDGNENYLATAIIFLILFTSAFATLIAMGRKWRELGICTAATVPGLYVAFGVALMTGTGEPNLPSRDAGWLAWPLAFAWHLALVRAQPRWLGRGALGWLHTLGLWLFVFLAAKECAWRIAPAVTGSGWEVFGWLLVPACVVALLATRLRGRWPVADFTREYLGRACAPIILVMIIGIAYANLASPGNAQPLPYVPLLNPLELGFALAFGSTLLWWRATPTSFAADAGNAMKASIALFGLYLLSGAVLRACHHGAGIPWDLHALLASRLVQAALSITWAVCGVLAMVVANRRVSRATWIGGAALIAAVVAKLFLVDLADRGGLYRIVSFIVVGLLLLLVGYFAPVPPKPRTLDAAAAT